MKKNIKSTLLLSIFLSAVTINSKAQAPNTWTKKGDLGIARVGSVAFSIGAKGYIGTGQTTTYTKDFWEYNPITDTWSQKADFGGEARVDATGFSLGDKGYIACGNNGNIYKNDFWEYNSLTNAWTQKTNFPGPPRLGAVSFSIGLKGYLGIGLLSFSPAIRTNDFWEYDPAIDVWTQKSNIGDLARSYGVGFSIGAKGYIGTGHIGSTLSKDFWEYDPTTDTWIRKADFGGVGRFQAVGIGTPSYGYVGLGDIGGGYTNDFWEYDPTLDSWTQKADFGGPARTNCKGFSILNKVFVGTGSDWFNLISYKDFWEFTPYCIPPVISRSGDTLVSTAVTGNQWYLDGAEITGSTGQEHKAISNGTYYTIVTENGCGSAQSNSILVLDASIKEVSTSVFDIFPNPSNGVFSIKIKTTGKEVYDIAIYNTIGAIIWKQDKASVNGNSIIKVNLNSPTAGLYTVVLRNKDNSYAKKIYLNK